MKKILRILLTILPIGIAVLVAAFLIAKKTAPVRKEVSEVVTPLRIIEVPVVDLVPQAIGYGIAEPERVWEAIAEVKGTISYINPNLKSGELIKADTTLIEIDRTELELTISRLEANVDETQLKIKELAAEEINTQSLLDIEYRSLELAQKSLDRKKNLMEANALSRDAVDQEERNYLQQQKSVRQLKNGLTLIPTKKKALDAVLSVHRINLNQAKIDLSKTTITAPLNCRLSDVRIDIGQVVRAGQLLFKAFSVDVVEIEARFRAEELRNIVHEEQRPRFEPGMKTGTFRQLFEQVDAFVIFQSGEWTTKWEARIDRLRESVDLRSGEIKVVVAVDSPYDKARPGVRPPLSAGMFCQVELHAPILKKVLIIPRTAIYDNIVFVVDHENRLRKQVVTVDFFQSEFAVITSGISGGRRIIVSDPSPTIIGMKVSPIIDDNLKDRLLALSRGEKI